MTECDFNHLELQVETLIKTKEHLRLENHSLRHKLSRLTQERAALHDKNKSAANRIKRTLAQLRNEMA